MRQYIAYQMVATAVTLNDLEGHSPVADVFIRNPSNICAAIYTISTDSVLAWFLWISRASCQQLSQKPAIIFQLTQRVARFLYNSRASCSLFACFQILCNICKFCTKFCQLILKKSINLLQPDVKVKMHQIQCRLGLRPDPDGGTYSALLQAQLDLRSILREGKGWQKENQGGEERERDGTEEKVTQGLVHTPCEGRKENERGRKRR